MSRAVEEKLKKLGLNLPEPPEPIANYVQAVKVGNLVYVSGMAPLAGGKPRYVGKVGQDLTEKEGYKAAEICALNCLSVVKKVIGSLDKIERIVKLTGIVNSANGFARQSWVVDGASDLLVKIFGEKGKHSRTVIGANGLPMDIAVDIDLLVQTKT